MIFFLIPNTFTAWSGTYLLGASIFYLISAVKGISDWSYPAFFIPYWIWVFAVLLSDIETIKFYFSKTLLDGWIMLIFKIGFFCWALMNFFSLN